MTRKRYCLEPGTEKYEKTFKLREQFNQSHRNQIIPDTVIFLEHHPCFIVNRKGGINHLLESYYDLQTEGIMVYETDRVGDIIYQGLGQIVCYPIIDLNNYGRDVHSYARNME